MWGTFGVHGTPYTACVADQLGKKKDRDQLIQVLIDLENDKRRSQGLAVWIAYAKRLKQFLKKTE